MNSDPADSVPSAPGEAPVTERRERRHPKGRWRRLGWLLLLVPIGLGLARLRLNTDVLNLLPDQLPVVQGLKLYQRHFTDTRELLITLQAADAQSAESAARQVAERLRSQTQLVASAISEPPWQSDPAQLAPLLAHLWLNQPTGHFAQLAQRLAPQQLEAALRDTRQRLATTLSPTDIARLSYDPLGLTQLPPSGASGLPSFGGDSAGFASPDGTFRVVFVEAAGRWSNFRAASAWLEQIRATVHAGAQSPDWPKGVRVRYTGAPAFVSEMATGMERDLRVSALTTLALIAALFWWFHRSWRPLLWLLTLLAVILVATLAGGGLVFGELNAVSVGFTAILLGLAVDYGLVLYQECRAAPHLTPPQVRRRLAPGIVWSAVTTATAFLLLNCVGLPGLSQLGSLVAMGVLLAAAAMLYLFLPVVLRKPTLADTKTNTASGFPPSVLDPRQASRGPSPLANAGPMRKPAFALLATGLLLLLAVATLWHSWPQIDHGTAALQPKSLAAQAAFDELQSVLNRQGEPFLLVVSGRDEAEVAQRLGDVSAHLSRAAGEGEDLSVLLPTALWPHPERLRANGLLAAGLVRQADEMKVAILRAGFTRDAYTLAEGIVQSWEATAATPQALWPTNTSCQWLLKRSAAWTGEQWLAAGTVYVGTNSILSAERLVPAAPGVWLTAWPLLGDALLKHVENRLIWVMAAMVTLVALCLWLAFRRWQEVLLSFVTVGFSLLALLTVMGLAGWSWNLMNLTAVPLLLGAGVDYTIHIQMALRRNAGNVLRTRQITGRAVFLCAATTAIGFGSTALSGNAGLASLGLVCATGIAVTFLTAVFLLPAWWRVLTVRRSAFTRLEAAEKPSEGGSSSEPLQAETNGPAGDPSLDDPPQLAKPSSFYRSEIWSLGLLLGRILPVSISTWLAQRIAFIYFCIHLRRREVVVQNLLPVFQGDREQAERAARRLFQEFALKVTDLWRYESGASVEHWHAEWRGWEVFAAAFARGQGVLLVTPHLGNWEFGGAFLARRGLKLLVLTQAEPEQRLTELRQHSRARWGIETLVVGEDAFAFVEIIKRLQAGAIVALLVDRPPPPTGVTVELFGQPFRASIAAAELARASGCALLPTVVVRIPGGYLAEILPEIPYERAAIGDRAGRVRLTQEILRAFEPAIRQHVEQWYHFVPIWSR